MFLCTFYINRVKLQVIGTFKVCRRCRPSSSVTIDSHVQYIRGGVSYTTFFYHTLITEVHYLLRKYCTVHYSGILFHDYVNTVQYIMYCTVHYSATLCHYYVNTAQYIIYILNSTLQWYNMSLLGKYCTVHDLFCKYCMVH